MNITNIWEVNMNNKFLDTEQINQIINITNYYKKEVVL